MAAATMMAGLRLSGEMFGVLSGTVRIGFSVPSVDCGRGFGAIFNAGENGKQKDSIQV